MEIKKRKALALFTVGIILVIMAFLGIINQAQPPQMQGALHLTLVILGGFAVGVLLLFIFFGEIFNEDGSMQRSQIMLMVTAVILIMQITLAFATYSFKQLEFKESSLQRAEEIYQLLKEDFARGDLSSVGDEIGEDISNIAIVDVRGVVMASSVAEDVGKTRIIDPLKSYRFSDGTQTVVMDISLDHQNRVVGKILLDLLTVLVASIILTIELVFFMVKFVEDKYARPSEDDPPSNYRMVGYVRQIAFLFYFASSLAVAFIAVIALELGGSFLGFTGNVLAGFPQSAEFLFTCVAIFATARIIEKRGWKVSFVGGLGIVAVGTLLSALATDIAFFIFARAVVGLGYGFCWMTLRNFALFTKSDSGKNTCFAMLNAGIYAGIICGAGLGSVLADIVGYTPVLLIAAGLTLLCSAAVLKLQNATYHKPVLTEQPGEAGLRPSNARYLPQVVFFIVLMIVPACIVGSFLGYYLPIYFTQIGKTTSDIGRAQLIYSLIIVYAGPFLARALNRYPSLFRWNLAYNAIFSAALIFFGLTGGFIPAMLVVLVFGFADSFGFVAQNNYFLNLEYVKKSGESRALSYVSLIKKQAEMLGPIAFGFTFMVGSFQGVALMGIIFMAGVAVYAIVSPGLRNLMKTRES